MSDVSDFDFWMGEWNVDNRRLRRRLAGAIRVRFTWSGVTTPTPRWEQAFSDDGGETWETNWVMDFTRAGGDT